jgi:hypothetical protein
MDNLQGYSPPIGTTPSDNWNYNNLEGRYLRISISKCRIFLLLFRVAQIAEIEVYGCEKTDQGPILHENTIHAGQEVEKLINSEEENDLQENPNVHPSAPSVPGKPSIRFHK